MEQSELIVVQLEEAKGMIEKGRVAHLQLAFILLDSVTELILHRTVQSELWDQEMVIGLLSTYKQLAAHGSAEAAAEAEATAARSFLRAGRGAAATPTRTQPCAVLSHFGWRARRANQSDYVA
ncbi:hypothetical protein [Streptomyces europaeiscabiei]|uniref:hypothetical protein n=1 Tax=Streptomyces europaeiscabiei TaxID=146819 RepID=UPI0029BA24A7|nr:hypothetical protein [Streptomyces europaeiscabiei]MDX3844957.1 hypothetical protein [Streptomyces europaeiscabiei]